MVLGVRAVQTDSFSFHWADQTGVDPVTCRYGSDGDNPILDACRRELGDGDHACRHRLRYHKHT